MYLHANLGPSTSRLEDCRVGAAFAIGLGACAAFFLGLYWLMQPTVSANSGLADYRPPPKTVVKDAYAPWVPPSPSDVLLRRGSDEPRPEIAKRAPSEEPKKEAKETKKSEARTAQRQARPAREQANPFWGGFGQGGYAQGGYGQGSYGQGGYGRAGQGYAQSRSSGSRPWF